jgi:hypothetical protein
MSEPGPDPQPPPPARPEPDLAVEPPEEPEPGPVGRWSRAGPVGAMLCFAAAALTMLGAFQDLFTAQPVGPGSRESVIITSWDIRIEINEVARSDTSGAPPNGAPLMFAVVVLLAAAVLGMLAATRPSRPRLGWVSGLTAVIGAAFLAAVVGTIGAQEVWWHRALGTESLDGGFGPGFWSLIAATGLAVVAAVVVWRPAVARPEPQQREEPETSPVGIPVVVRRLPDAPPDHPVGG